VNNKKDLDRRDFFKKTAAMSVTAIAGTTIAASNAKADDPAIMHHVPWGQKWGMYKGQPGIAHWSYEDWAENIIDAWVLRLSVPTPDAFGLSIKPVRKTTEDGQEEFSFLRPRRYEINGHFIQLDDGKLV